MTIRMKGLYVALEQDMRSDDVQGLIDAIRYFRYVADVTADEVDFVDFAARAQVRADVGERVMVLLAGREVPHG